MLSAVVFAVVFALCTHVHVVWAQVLQGTIVPGEFFLSFFFFFLFWLWLTLSTQLSMLP
jgi:hypothetical protein